MNDRRYLPLTVVAGLALLGSNLQAQNAGVGSSGTQSTQTFPGSNPAPSTASTPTEATQKGTVPGTASTSPTTPGGATPPTAPNVTPNASNAQANGTMSTIVVNGSTEGSVLPSDQTVTSVYGTDMSLQDTPRNVTAVSSELLQSANISSLSDFVKVTPSAYTLDQFGVADVPTIRGQNAEVFINGMQRTSRSGGPPTSFNSVEQADVVTGPASSIYGPTQNTGGYVNLVTKQPFFDAFHSDTEFTYGSYNEKIWTEDFGAPIIKNQLAYRVSYQGDYAGSYYENEKTQSNDGFIALAWTPNTGFRVDFNSEFYDGRFDENTGWNRPTQGLISGHQYSTGGVYPFAGTAAGGPGVILPPVAAPPNTPGLGGFGSLTYSPGTQQLSEQATLVSPNDSDYGKDYNAELTETYNVNDNVTLINHSYYEYYYIRNSEFAQLYINIDQSNIAQDRFEAHIDFDTPIGGGDPKGSSDASKNDSKDMKAATSATSEPFIDPKNEIITGFAFKYVDALGYGDYFNEALNATDLTTGNFPEDYEPLFGVHHIPGTNLFGTAGTDDMPNTFNETAYEASAFFQHQITFTPQWILLYSGRADAIFDDLNDPLGSAVGNYSHETTSQVLGTADVSVDYKPFKWATVYGTFDFNESTIGNDAGGFAEYSDGAPAVDYHYKNYLYEGGLKLDLLNHTLFTTADGYFQTHNTTAARGASEELRTFGADLQTIYQPDKHFYISLNESYLNSTVVNPAAEITENVYDDFSTNSRGVNGTGVGSPNFIALPVGDYREGGLPQFVFSGIASYKMDNGFGVSANYVITDPIPTSELTNVWIPWQYEIDTSLFYEQKGFSARLTLFNITDQHNFSSGGTLSGAGNDLVTVHEPFHWEATVGYKF